MKKEIWVKGKGGGGGGFRDILIKYLNYVLGHPQKRSALERPPKAAATY